MPRDLKIDTTRPRLESADIREAYPDQEVPQKRMLQTFFSSPAALTTWNSRVVTYTPPEIVSSISSEESMAVGPTTVNRPHPAAEVPIRRLRRYDAGTPVALPTILPPGAPIRAWEEPVTEVKPGTCCVVS